MFDWFRRKGEKNNKVRTVHKVYTPQEPKPIHHEIYPVTLRPPEPASSCVLKQEFCCDEGKAKAKLIVTNHTSALWDCNERKCRKILLKFPIGGSMN